MKTKQGKIVSAPEEVSIVPEFVDIKAEREKALEVERIKDNKMVRGMFKFHEVPGGILKKFPYRKYKKDGIRRYTFVDGEIYTIPLGVANHLNENGSYPVHAHSTDAGGKPSINIGKDVHRFSFSPLAFGDISDSNSGATMVPDKIDSK